MALVILAMKLCQWSRKRQQQQQQAVGSDSNSLQSQKNRLTIVDYGHEEGAISPEAEEGEILAAGRVMYGEKLQAGDGESREKKSPGVARLPTPSTQATSPRSLEPNDQPELEAMNAKNESELTEIEDAVMVSIEEQKDVDPLDKFLPTPPKGKCSDELQEKIIKFLALKKTTGRSFNAEVRNRKEYRNPDFLLHAVTYQDIDQIGSCFSKDVFDPHGYDKSDFYDEIEADMRREMERREQERKKTQKLDFASGGIQPGNVVPTPKISMPTPGLTAVATATSDVTARDGRQNKKSKWMLINGILWRQEGKKICLLSVLMQHFSLLLKLVVDTQRLRNREERRQKISDLVTRSWREDHRVVLLMLNLEVGTSIATDMKIKRVAVAGILSLRPVLRTHTVDMAVYEAYLDNNIIPFKSFSSQSVLLDRRCYKLYTNGDPRIMKCLMLYFLKARCLLNFLTMAEFADQELS
ncbi:uncharacterized protein LOC105179476 isoform X2 [Sesamum indicum]|uniref:Uncharacterized protein LOC105179476 isoform X2 n=1 Tax=Sesamum indicum TaxID=4182 RepID=A0A6I9V199_SESIN|nr:uncharacterized protein LOC105179476 isoform X2 [Sesamum indicum]